MKWSQLKRWMFALAIAVVVVGCDDGERTGSGDYVEADGGVADDAGEAGVADDAAVSEDAGLEPTACDDALSLTANDAGAHVLLTTTHGMDHGGTCGGDGVDAVVVFTAPEAGLWRFRGPVIVLRK